MRVAVFATAALFAGTCAAGLANSGPAFFPTPPPGVTFKTMKGVLTDYAIGMKAGTIAIRLANGTTVTFLVAEKMEINGRYVYCLAPPNSGQSPPPELCPDWPATLKIGSSNVTMFYWDTTYQGATAHVTDKLSSP